MRTCYDIREKIIEQNKLYFHTWAGLSEQPFAIVETQLGFIKFLEPKNIWLLNEWKNKEVNFKCPNNSMVCNQEYACDACPYNEDLKNEKI